MSAQGRPRPVPVTAPVPAPCFCCATWGMYVPGTRREFPKLPGLLCTPCADTDPDECNKRHADALQAGEPAGIVQSPPAG